MSSSGDSAAPPQLTGRSPLSANTCPHCGSNDISLQLPVWVAAASVLNENEPLNGSDVVYRSQWVAAGVLRCGAVGT